MVERKLADSHINKLHHMWTADTAEHCGNRNEESLAFSGYYFLLYYLTIIKDQNAPVKGYFHNFTDVMAAHETGVLKLHDKVIVRDENGHRIETTPGRIIFNEAVRKSVLA